MSYARNYDEYGRKYDGNLYNTDQVSLRSATVVNPCHRGYVEHLSSPQASYAPVPAPRTEMEKYWAYRAIVAEAKLAERSGWRTDKLQTMKEEPQRQSEVDAVRKYYEDRVLLLERLILGLTATIVLITLVLLFNHHGSHSETRHSKRAFRPHLTIPILSPFTSIIEHEDSKFSFRSTATFLIILGGLGYALFRHWLHQRPR